MPRRVLIGVLALGVGLLGWMAVLVGRDQHFRTELRRAKRELGNQQLEQARKRLDRASPSRWPGRGDVEYWLGTCEMAAGNADAALEAWSRVPAKRPRSGAGRAGFRTPGHG